MLTCGVIENMNLNRVEQRRITQKGKSQIKGIKLP